MATLETKTPWFIVAAALVALAVQPLLSQVPELETVFYGRIVNRTSGQEFQVTSGTLKVTVTGEGVTPLELTTEIKPYAGGKYSYVLKMPHQAKSLDLSVDGGKLPLFTSDTGYENVSMTVDGELARPFGNGPTSFVASQPKRGGLHRLDIELFTELDDTDKDGIPDWWEDLHGLDKQDKTDALQRWGNNLYNYFDAFRLGLDPHSDDRVPELLTSELMVMENGKTGLLIRTVASTSTPSQIRYRVTTLPLGGDLILRNSRPDPKASDRILKDGDSFTQAEINAGKLEFLHNNPAVLMTQLHVAITNNNPDAEPLEGQIDIVVYRPEAAEGRAAETWLKVTDAGAPKKNDSALDIWRQRATESFPDDWVGGKRQRDWIAAFMLARRHGYTVWDGSKELPVNDLKVPSSGITIKEYKALYLKLYGPARKHVLFAGNGVCHIEGGMNNDVLIAGVGETTLRGNGGADYFVASEGKTIIDDFNAAEADMLDLSPLLEGWPGPLEEKIAVSFNAGNTWLRIQIDADREAIIILKGLNLSVKQIEALRRKGQIFSGAISGTIYATNRAPVAVTDEGYVVAGQPVSIAVIANDFDPDGDSLSVANVTQGEYGTVQVIDDIAVYNPGPNFAGEDKFTYTINDGQGGFTDGTVKISYPYPAASGTYTSLIFDEDGMPMGQFTLTLLRGGNFSVKVTLGKVRFTGKGGFDADGDALVTLKAGKNTVDLQLNLDLADPAYPLTGSLVGSTEEAILATTIAAANPKLVPTTAKRYTLSLLPPTSTSSLSGHGFATVTISTGYAARIVGKLVDGTAFTASVKQDKAGSLLWSTSLYKGAGWLQGQLSLADGGGESPSGSFKWSKPEGATPAFIESLPATISAYLPPSTALVSALDFPNESDRRADLHLNGGGLAEDLDLEVTFNAKDIMVAPAPVSKLRLNRASGLFTATVLIDGVKRPLLGTILQNEDLGYGFFLNGLSTGAVKLSPK